MLFQLAEELEHKILASHPLKWQESNKNEQETMNFSRNVNSRVGKVKFNWNFAYYLSQKSEWESGR